MLTWKSSRRRTTWQGKNRKGRKEELSDEKPSKKEGYRPNKGKEMWHH